MLIEIHGLFKIHPLTEFNPFKASSKYSLSISSLVNWTPNLLEAIAVKPMPKRGSVTTKPPFELCFMHMYGSFIGNVAVQPLGKLVMKLPPPCSPN